MGVQILQFFAETMPPDPALVEQEQLRLEGLA